MAASGIGVAVGGNGVADGTGELIIVELGFSADGVSTEEGLPVLQADISMMKKPIPIRIPDIFRGFIRLIIPVNQSGIPGVRRQSSAEQAAFLL